MTRGPRGWLDPHCERLALLHTLPVYPGTPERGSQTVPQRGIGLELLVLPERSGGKELTAESRSDVGAQAVRRRLQRFDTY